MRWEEVREQFPNEWVVCEALQSRSEDGYYFIDEVAVIDRFDDSKVAMKRYYELHRELVVKSFLLLNGFQLQMNRKYAVEFIVDIAEGIYSLEAISGILKEYSVER